LIGFALTVLNLAVSRSILSLGARFQAYGVIGSVLVLTLWVWMVGVVIYFGQCWSVELAKDSFSMEGIRTDRAKPECKKTAIMESQFVWSVD
jgi:membrane protein